MKWYQIKERSAGTKRLYATLFLYKILKKPAVCCIAFFVALFTFLGSACLRKFSSKILSAAGLKPTCYNVFRHILSYALALVDKFQTFLGEFNSKKLFFPIDTQKTSFYADLAGKKGVVILTSHLGNINVLRSFFSSDELISGIETHIFASENQSQIFNQFLQNVSKAPADVVLHSITDISPATALSLKDRLDSGAICFIAADRLSESSMDAAFCADFLDKKAKFPIGAFKFALLFDVPVYAVFALREKGGKYSVFAEKFNSPLNVSKKENLKNLQNFYIKTLEEKTRQYPLQFYHFYDFFEE